MPKRRKSFSRSTNDSNRPRVFKRKKKMRSKTTDDLSSVSQVNIASVKSRRRVDAKGQSNIAANDAPDLSLLTTKKSVRKRRDSQPSADINRLKIKDTQPTSKTTDDLGSSSKNTTKLKKATDTGGDIIDSNDTPSPVKRRKSVSDLDTSQLNSAVQANKKRRKSIDNSALPTIEDIQLRPDTVNLPIVKRLNLLDSSNDNDSDDDIDLVGQVIVPKSPTYDTNQSNWKPLPENTDKALRTLFDELKKDEFINPALTETIENAFSDDNEKVSRDLLNDVYFMSKRQIETAEFFESLNISTDIETGIKDQAQALINAIDSMEDKSSFINVKYAIHYRLNRMKNTDVDSKNLLLRERALVDEFSGDLRGVTLVKNSVTDVASETVRNYRNNIMDRLEGDLDSLAKEFSFTSKTIKKEKHTLVQKETARFTKQLKSLREYLNQADTNPEMIGKFNLALLNLNNSLGAYISTSKHPDRVKAAERARKRIDSLTVPDDRILYPQITEALTTLDKARDALAKAKPDSVQKFDVILENLLFNASPEAVLQTPLYDSLGQVLSIFKETDKPLDMNLGSNQNVNDFNTGLQLDSAAVGIFGDVFKAVHFIQGLQQSETTSKTQILDGGLTATNITKNVSNLTAQIISLTKTTSEVAKDIGNVTSNIVPIASTVIGLGFAGHGTLIAIKTGARLDPAKNIEDEKLKRQLIARIETKKRRAILRAIGGTLAVVGGVAAIVATAGAATPALVAAATIIGTTAGTGATVVGSGSSLAKVTNKVRKGKNVGKERAVLAEKLFTLMRHHIAEGDYQKAKELAQAMTNNKTKQVLMLNGSEQTATKDEGQVALFIMNEKLKTW